MKDPEKPVAPAFDKARDAAEHWRQAQLAQLSEQERQAFEQLKRDQALREEDRGQRLAEDRARKVFELMKERLAPRHSPEFRIGGAREQLPLEVQKRIYDAVQDYLGGRKTGTTEKYKAQLQTAEAKARSDIGREETRALAALRAGQERERDLFLKARQQKRERREQKQGQVRENAHETAWHAAVAEAARQEDRRDRDLGDEFTRSP